jgi:ABC-type transport system substrate-binding protein
MTSSIHFRRSLAAALLLSGGFGCGPAAAPKTPATPGLAGAWKSTIEFQGGALAAFKGLEFMYVFAAGGTMTESSNYDAAPPVPPAYGIWREVGPDRYEARYEFYTTRPAATPAESTLASGGWLPAGYGVLRETITLAPDGRTFDSTIRLDLYDPSGKPIEGGGTGTSRGRRMGFD